MFAKSKSGPGIRKKQLSPTTKQTIQNVSGRRLKTKSKSKEEFAIEILDSRKLDHKEINRIYEIMEDVAHETGDYGDELELNEQCKKRVMELLEEDLKALQFFEKHQNSKLKERIPEVMSARVFDEIIDSKKGINSKSFEDFDKAITHMKKHDGVIITQTDAEGETYYEKGNRIVNRTGRYEVLTQISK